jgi:hypothetical protein
MAQRGGGAPAAEDVLIRRRVPWGRWLVAAFGVSLVAAVAVL